LRPRGCSSGAARRRARERREGPIRRRLAIGLIVYGVVGLLILAGSVPLLIEPLASIGRTAGQRGEAVHWLELTGQGLKDVGRGSANAGASLASASAAARNAASLAQELSASMTSLRDASRLSILGSQPFAGITGRLDRVAGRAGDLAVSITSLAGPLDRDTTDFDPIAADAASLQGQVDALRPAFASPELGEVVTSAGLLGAAALVLLPWLGTPAVASLIAGIWLLRITRGNTGT
jgi:hypothetical protein